MKSPYPESYFCLFAITVIYPKVQNFQTVIVLLFEEKTDSVYVLKYGL